MRIWKGRRRIGFIAAVLLVAGVGVWNAAARQFAAPAGTAIRRLYDAGQYQQAVTALQEAIRQQPEDASLRYWLGRCFYELQVFNKAVPSLEQAVQLDPDNSVYHDWLGRAYGRKAERSNPFSAFSLARKAHREFEAAVRLDKSNLAAQRDLIRYLLNAPGIVGGGEDRALHQIAALSVVSTVEADLARAEYFEARKRYDLAGEQYAEVLRADPSSVGVYLEVADYYAGRGDVERTRKAVQAAASVAPADPRLDYYRGAALVLAKEKPDQAEKWLRSYLATVPDNSEVPSHAWAHEWLGRLYAERNRMDDAAREFRRAVALNPHNRTFREALKKIKGK